MLTDSYTDGLKLIAPTWISYEEFKALREKRDDELRERLDHEIEKRRHQPGAQELLRSVAFSIFEEADGG